MKNIKLYDIHGKTAVHNYDTLKTDDNNFFYWDDKSFSKLDIGDYALFVSRKHKEAFLTEIEKIDIKPTIINGQNVINDNGYTLYDNYPKDGINSIFLRFKIIQLVEIPDNWNYADDSSFAYQNMEFGLVIKGKKIDDKVVSKANDLLKIFKEGIGFNLLSEIVSLKDTTIKKIKARTNITKLQIVDSMQEKLILSIKTKPFILLAGISGTGKSRLVRTLAYKTCSKEELRKDPKKPGNFELIPIRPNWHDSSELMGYVSRIGKDGEKYIITSYLRFIAKAWRHIDVPFFLCLDEMNLAPVEQYFAEYLSIIETRQIKEGKLVTDFIISKESFENQELYIQLLNDLELDETNFKEGISIPSNLIVIGTVNMDETTHSFSRKVLDRAMTFEMNNVDLTAGLDLNTEDWGYPKSADEYFNSDDVIGKYTSGAEVYSIDFKEKDDIINFLKKINNELEGTPFKIAYRVRDEFLIYCFYASLKPTNDWLTIALDEMTSMKILSRIEGDETKTEDVIEKLLKLLDLTYPKSNNKLNEMKNKLQFGYTSFWS